MNHDAPINPREFPIRNILWDAGTEILPEEFDRYPFLTLDNEKCIRINDLIAFKRALPSLDQTALLITTIMKSPASSLSVPMKCVLGLVALGDLHRVNKGRIAHHWDDIEREMMVILFMRFIDNRVAANFMVPEISQDGIVVYRTIKKPTAVNHGFDV